MSRLHQENGGLMGATPAVAGSAPKSGTVLSLPLNADSSGNLQLTDLSGASHAVTNNGVNWQTSVANFYGGAAQFNPAESDYISLGGSATSGADDWLWRSGSKLGTIEAWIYLRSHSNPDEAHRHRCIYGRGGTYINFGVLPNGKLRFYWWTGSPNSFDSAGTVSLNTWTHVAASFNGSQITLWINGVSQGSTAFDGIEWATSAIVRYIGREETAATSLWDGFIQDFRISNFNRYSANFVPPSALVATAQRGSGVWKIGSSPFTTAAEQVETTAADAGNGGGWSAAQGADATNVTGFTNSSMTYHWVNATNQGVNGQNPFTYTWSNGSFVFHSGHQSSWWPMYLAVNVTSAEKGKVLNEIQWIKHGNAIGNVDIFGSNLPINAGNFSTESNWTFLGRVHMGGFGSAADGTVMTSQFNRQGYGYKWYLIKGADYNSGFLAYPQVGGRNGWAMYGLRLNKVSL